jgi:hypothetical protein
MPLWNLAVPLDPDLPEPLHMQLVSGLITRIQNGSRAVAEQLGFHRNHRTPEHTDNRLKRIAAASVFRFSSR